MNFFIGLVLILLGGYLVVNNVSSDFVVSMAGGFLIGIGVSAVASGVE